MELFYLLFLFLTLAFALDTEEDVVKFKDINCEQLRDMCTPYYSVETLPLKCKRFIAYQSPTEEDKKEQSLEERKCICRIRIVQDLVDELKDGAEGFVWQRNWANFCAFDEERVKAPESIKRTSRGINPFFILGGIVVLVILVLGLWLLLRGI